MKRLLFLLLISLPIISFAQEQAMSPNPEVSTIYIEEELPEYPGGSREMIKFIQKNVQYPDSAREENIQGKVYLTFVVDTTGKLDDISVIKSVHPSLDKEAIRVIKKMPKWKPGTQKGKPVRVKFNLPINFKLD
ncbi:MAG: energy transducer TonB [Vicingaceae bacterium]